MSKRKKNRQGRPAASPARKGPTNVDEAVRALQTINGRVRKIEDERDELVAAARDLGATWAVIGDAVGMSAQAAHKRWRTAVHSAGKVR